MVDGRAAQHGQEAGEIDADGQDLAVDRGLRRHHEHGDHAGRSQGEPQRMHGDVSQQLASVGGHLPMEIGSPAWVFKSWERGTPALPDDTMLPKEAPWPKTPALTASPC